MWEGLGFLHSFLNKTREFLRMVIQSKLYFHIPSSKSIVFPKGVFGVIQWSFLLIYNKCWKKGGGFFHSFLNKTQSSKARYFFIFHHQNLRWVFGVVKTTNFPMLKPVSWPLFLKSEIFPLSCPPFPFLAFCLSAYLSLFVCLCRCISACLMVL